MTFTGLTERVNLALAELLRLDAELRKPMPNPDTVQRLLGRCENVGVHV